MARRYLVAFALVVVVVYVTQWLFPTPRPAPGAGLARDSVAASARTGPTQDAPGAPAAARRVEGAVDDSLRAAPESLATAAAVETTVVATPRSVVALSSLGAAPVSARLIGYRSLAQGDTSRVDLVRARDRMLRFAIVSQGDTIDLSNTRFAVADSAQGAWRAITYTAPVGNGSVAIRWSTQAHADTSAAYMWRIDVRTTGLGDTPFLLVHLPPGFRSQEADSSEDFTHRAYAFKPARRDAESIGFGELDPGEKTIEAGPHEWVVAKSKYFLVGLLAPPTDSTARFAELQVTGAPRVSKSATQGEAVAILPLTNGDATFSVYAGPQEWKRLRAIGQDFENANPYGGWFSGLVTPFATIVMRILLWMKATFQVSYGWVLVIFGVAIRLLLWPLNQSAMRTSLKMQRIQPELQAVQKRYAANPDPQKMQQEMMKVYAAHGMSPFSTFSGCLPMLIPMPVLFALFFVFQNTIEFRGVPFLWLPDISLKDPYYIVPVLMGLSMFLLSWVGMRNAPPNPQAKMMGYLFPPLMTIFFLNFASGLNLYYFVQNLAALPQQWLIANERAKQQAAPVVQGPVATKQRNSSGGRR